MTAEAYLMAVLGAVFTWVVWLPELTFFVWELLQVGKP